MQSAGKVLRIGMIRPWKAALRLGFVNLFLLDMREQITLLYQLTKMDWSMAYVSDFDYDNSLIGFDDRFVDVTYYRYGRRVYDIDEIWK